MSEEEGGGVHMWPSLRFRACAANTLFKAYAVRCTIMYKYVVFITATVWCVPFFGTVTASVLKPYSINYKRKKTL